MNKILQPILAILLIIIGGYLGLERGFEAAHRAASGADRGWHNASLPNGIQADHFVIGDAPVIGIRARGAELYARFINPNIDSGWEKVHSLYSLESDYEGYGGCSLRPEMIIPDSLGNPPGRITDRMECSFSRHAEHSYNIEYVILEDGSIYRWDSEKSMANFFFAPFMYIMYLGFYGLIGVSAGFLSYAVLGCLWWIGSQLLKGWQDLLILLLRSLPFLTVLMIPIGLYFSLSLFLYLSLKIAFWWAMR
jgi:hypothetical protein